MILLSHVRCLFCGKDSAVSSFDPSELDLDIYTRQVSGLGYKKGFAFGPNVSVLGDDVFTPKFKDRSLAFIRLLMESGIMTPWEVQTKLKIGIPIHGSDDVIPFENFCIACKSNTAKEFSKIKGENYSLRSRVNASISYKEMYDDLIDSVNKKKRVEKVLIWLHDSLESEIFIEKGEWILHIKEYELDIALKLCKRLYTLKREERELLEKRIYTGYLKYKSIFNALKNEPTINALFDAETKRPSDIYYRLHNLPIP